MAIFIALFSMANMAFAEADDNALAMRNNKDYSNCNTCPPKKEECCPCPKECIKSPSKCSCCDYMTCCPMLPLPVKCGNLFMEGEYLYWKTYTVVPYAITRTVVPPFTSGLRTIVNEDVNTVKMDGSSGYRLTLGAYFSDCWFGLGTFRQYDTDGTNSVSVRGVDGFPLPLQQWISAVWATNPANSDTNNGGPPVSASARQRHREKVLDFDFLKEFACSRFTFSPFLGVRFAWVKSDLRVDYFQNFTPGTGTVSYNNHVDVNNHMNLGVGLHTGMLSNIDLGWGFGFYGTSGLAALVGQFQFEHREDVTDEFTGTDFPVTYTSTRSYKVTDFQTTWELGVGLNWGHHFCDCGYYLGLKVGYEANIWPNFFRSFHTLRTTSVQNNAERMSLWTRSILTHGLNVGARFDF